MHEGQKRHTLKIEQKGDRVSHKIPNEAELCAAMAISTNYTFAKKGVSVVGASENQGTNSIRPLKYWAADTAGTSFHWKSKTCWPATYHPCPQLLNSYGLSKQIRTIAMLMAFKKKMYLGQRRQGS